MLLDVGFVNLVSVISQNPRVTAINSCIEVDLTGQVVSDSIGTRMYSGMCGIVSSISIDKKFVSTSWDISEKSLLASRYLFCVRPCPLMRFRKPPFSVS